MCEYEISETQSYHIFACHHAVTVSIVSSCTYRMVMNTRYDDYDDDDDDVSLGSVPSRDIFN